MKFTQLNKAFYLHHDSWIIFSDKIQNPELILVSHLLTIETAIQDEFGIGNLPINIPNDTH